MEEIFGLNCIISEIVEKKLIVKNTGLLYFRSILILLISLYTSRVILANLGISDYGIYNVVGGIVTMFSFLNSGMISASQRFISYSLGKGDGIDSLQKVFSMSVNIHFLIGGIILLIAETVGLWFLNAQMNIPTERLFAANIVYQCSIIAFLINVFSVPYNACILAHERMSIFAYISLVEVVLKLSAALLLTVVCGDKLIYYALFILIVAVLIRFLYGAYCRKSFEESKYHFSWDKSLFKSMTGFAIWSLWGNMGFSVKNQGINILLNLFFSPAINAARGVAYQVEAAVVSFTENFQAALRPRIVKEYAAGETCSMMSLVIAGSKFSFLILMIIAIPVLIEAPFLLALWLKDVPPYSVEFLRLAILTALIESMKGSLGEFFNATGKIRLYQILLSIIMLLTLPVAYVILKLGYSSYSVVYASLFTSLLALIMRLFLIKRIMNSFNIKDFLKDVCARNLLTFILVYSSLFCTSIVLGEESFLKLIILSVFSVLFSFIGIYTVAMNKKERLWIQEKIKTIVSRLK